MRQICIHTVGGPPTRWHHKLGVTVECMEHSQAWAVSELILSLVGAEGAKEQGMSVRQGATDQHRINAAQVNAAQVYAEWRRHMSARTGPAKTGGL